MPNVLFCVSDGYTEFNSSNFRVSIPVSAMFRNGHKNFRIMHISDWLKQTPRGVYMCGWADIIIIQRVLVDESINHTKLWTSRGKKVLVDFDDAYDMIREDNAAYKFWGEGLVDMEMNDGWRYEKKLDWHPVEEFRRGLRYASGLITPSRQLCEDWQPHAPAIYLPNYIDTKRYWATKKRKNREIIIGWGGSLSHVPGFADSGVSEALGKVMLDRNNVKFLLVGDSRVTPHLPIAQNNLMYSPYVKFSVWPSVLRRYDIGIAPLYGEYDCRRSHLKVMEYLAMGIPFVASRSVVYKEFFDASSGEYVDQGPLAQCDKTSVNEWYEALINVVDNIDEFRDRAELERRRYLPVYDVDANVPKMLDTFNYIAKEL